MTNVSLIPGRRVTLIFWVGLDRKELKVHDCPHLLQLCATVVAHLCCVLTRCNCVSKTGTQNSTDHQYSPINISVPSAMICDRTWLWKVCCCFSMMRSESSFLLGPVHVYIVVNWHHVCVHPTLPLPTPVTILACMLKSSKQDSFLVFELKRIPSACWTSNKNVGKGNWRKKKKRHVSSVPLKCITSINRPLGGWLNTSMKAAAFVGYYTAAWTFSSSYILRASMRAVCFLLSNSCVHWTPLFTTVVYGHHLHSFPSFPRHGACVCSVLCILFIYCTAQADQNGFRHKKGESNAATTLFTCGFIPVKP